MSKLTDLALELDNEYQTLLAEVARDKEELANLKKAVTAKKQALDEREDFLSGKEVAVTKRETEVEAKFAKVRNDADVQAQFNDTVNLKEEIDKKLKQVTEHEAEVGVAIELCQRKEEALTIREATYKKKIETEYQDKLKNLIK
jgi:hypothetical protein